MGDWLILAFARRIPRLVRRRSHPHTLHFPPPFPIPAKAGISLPLVRATPALNLRRWRRNREIPAFAGMGIFYILGMVYVLGGVYVLRMVYVLGVVYVLGGVYV